MSAELKFEKFPKIPALGRSLREGLVPTGEYAVTEKLDGANAGIIRTSAYLLLHSRNRVVAAIGRDGIEVYDDFRGFCDYIVPHAEWLLDNMKWGDRICGEWLVPHTISYPTHMYYKFYAFYQNLPRGLPFPTVPQVSKVGMVPWDGPDRPAEILSHMEALVQTHQEGVGRPIEGLVLTRLEPPDVPYRFKYVLPQFKEEAAKPRPAYLDGGVEEALVSMFNARHYTKAREGTQDLRGPALDKSHTPAVLGLAWRDFMQEVFPGALKTLKYPTIDTLALKKAFERRVRAMFHDELDSGLIVS